MSGMHKLCFVFEQIVNRLNDIPLSEHHLVIKEHKPVLHIRLIPCTQPQCRRQIRDQTVWERCSLCRKDLYGKVFADRGYISPKLFDPLFDDGIQLVHGIKTNMKNRLMFFYDKMMLRKRYIIETINDLLKNKAQLVHSRHRSITNFLVNLVAVLGAYCFFENKPDALQGYYIEDSKQLALF